MFIDRSSNLPTEFHRNDIKICRSYGTRSISPNLKSYKYAVPIGTKEFSNSFLESISLTHAFTNFVPKLSGSNFSASAAKKFCDYYFLIFAR